MSARLAGKKALVTAAGQGIQVVSVFQDLAQARGRYGEAADTIANTCGVRGDAAMAAAEKFATRALSSRDDLREGSAIRPTACQTRIPA